MITVLSQQSLFDVAIQTAGSAEAAFALTLSNDLSVTDDLDVGRELKATAAVEKSIESYYTSKQLKPATGITEDNLMSRIFDNTFDSRFN